MMRVSEFSLLRRGAARLTRALRSFLRRAPGAKPCCRSRLASDPLPYSSLSVIMPFFRKREAFERVLAINRPFLAKPHIEVVLALDEDSELEQVLDTIGRSPEVRWRAVACHEPHEWRPPAKAINVGVRHAEGDYILIVSPETAFINDVPSQVLAHLAAFPDAAICGRLSYSTFAELDRCRDAYEAMVQARYGTGLRVRAGSRRWRNCATFGRPPNGPRGPR